MHIMYEGCSSRFDRMGWDGIYRAKPDICLDHDSLCGYSVLDSIPAIQPVREFKMCFDIRTYRGSNEFLRYIYLRSKSVSPRGG